MFWDDLLELLRSAPDGGNYEHQNAWIESYAKNFATSTDARFKVFVDQDNKRHLALQSIAESWLPAVQRYTPKRDGHSDCVEETSIPSTDVKGQSIWQAIHVVRLLRNVVSEQSKAQNECL